MSILETVERFIVIDREKNWAVSEGLRYYFLQAKGIVLLEQLSDTMNQQVS